MTLLVLLIPAGMCVALVVAHERQVWDRRRRASENLRREFPTTMGRRLP